MYVKYYLRRAGVGDKTLHLKLLDELLLALLELPGLLQDGALVGSAPPLPAGD